MSGKTCDLFMNLNTRSGIISKYVFTYAQAPDDLRQFTSILVERCQDPMAMVPPTEEEQRLLASNVNSVAAFRSVG